MSTYIDSILLFILCGILYPGKQFDALHLLGILFLIALYCFELVGTTNSNRSNLSIIVLIFSFFFPELSVLLPWHSYVLFLNRLPAFALLYALPFLRYYCENPSYVNLAFIPIMALSYYLACNNNLRTELSETVHTLRDNSVEKEMMLKESTRHLVDSQNDQIYIATLKERNRIAREIHDNVGHMLSRSILQVGALLAICKDDTLKPHLTTLKETLDLAMNNIRNSVHDLHDESIDLQNALQGLVDSFTFCPVHFQCDISKQIPKNVKYCFLAITKEGMNNIMRHSNASRVTLTVKEHPAFYQLLIEDNGTTSLHSDNVSDNGMGISNMKERAEALHGILHISTESGFRIFVSIPK